MGASLFCSRMAHDQAINYNVYHTATLGFRHSPHFTTCLTLLAVCAVNFELCVSAIGSVVCRVSTACGSSTCLLHASPTVLVFFVGFGALVLMLGLWMSCVFLLLDLTDDNKNHQNGFGEHVSNY